MCNPLIVFATTAANSEESSYACYYDDDRETYLGDTYSVNWMEDSDKVSYLYPRICKMVYYIILKYLYCL